MGSPPRMRGKHSRRHNSSRVPGITPAHAGKTTCSRVAVRHRGDHPRACGENGDIIPRTASTKGSPPRMRGKHHIYNVVRLQIRITPAHAGKTGQSAILQKPKRDHPRACGENRSRAWKRKRKRGSPPRMRGKPVPLYQPNADRGITPAHAGKTCSQGRRAQCSRDHPRACGENVDDVLAKGGQQGSPPRMRGKLLEFDSPAFQIGITPAHAGKTPQNWMWTWWGRDHPRACGENTMNSYQAGKKLGSPPRMRGKHFGKGVFPWLILVLSLDPL